MIYKIIHSAFEIDLISQNIDFTEQNQWFVDGAPINYTLPITLTLTKELDLAFGMISHLNAELNQTSFDVKLYKMDKQYDAVLYINRIIDLTIELSFKYGFDEYPNFSKQLKDLPLEDKTVTSLRADGLAVKQSIWPATNYKYPAVIIPEGTLEEDSGRFEFFEDIINLFENDAYVENTFDGVDNITTNRTVLQPFAYMLHVLIQGFADAGFTLVGDILNNEKLKRLLIGKISDYYINFEPNQQQWLLDTDDLTITPLEIGGDVILEEIPVLISERIGSNHWANTFPSQYGIFEIELTENGRYKLAGNVFLRANVLGLFFFDIYLEDELIYSRQPPAGLISIYRPSQISVFIDLEINITSASTLKIVTLQDRGASVFPFEGVEVVSDFTLTQVASLVGANLVPTLNEADRVKLNETMPDKTFGDLVKAVMSWFNCGITIDVANAEVQMNLIKNVIDQQATQDLSNTEIKKPSREYAEEKSYLLSFTPKTDDSAYQQVMFSRRGIQTDQINKDENTEEINIGLFPVLHDTKNGNTTTNFESKEESEIAVFYDDGISETTNSTLNPTSLLLPNTFEEAYFSWLNFRLSATTFKWSSIISIEEALLVSVYKKSFAYNQVHYIKEYIVRLNDKDYAEVEFHTEA